MNFIDKLQYSVKVLNAAQYVIIGGGVITLCSLLGATLLLKYIVQ